MPHDIHIAALHRFCSLHTYVYVAQQLTAVGTNYRRSHRIPDPMDRFSKPDYNTLYTENRVKVPKM